MRYKCQFSRKKLKKRQRLNLLVTKIYTEYYLYNLECWRTKTVENNINNKLQHQKHILRFLRVQ